MTLSQEDGQLYYKLWLPLLDYVNKKYRVNRKLKSIATAKELDPAEVKKVANKLWSDVAIIDDYLKENNDLPEDHRKIIQSWKRRVPNRRNARLKSCLPCRGFTSISTRITLICLRARYPICLALVSWTQSEYPLRRHTKIRPIRCL